MSEYGAFINPERGKQLILFDQVSSGGIQATDVDALIEYHNRGYIIFEVKCVGAPMPTGQRLALERLVTDACRAGKKAIAIVAEHTVYDTSKPVIIKDCTVRELFLGSEQHWRKPKCPMTAGELTDAFIRLIDSGSARPKMLRSH